MHKMVWIGGTLVVAVTLLVFMTVMSKSDVSQAGVGIRNIRMVSDQQMPNGDLYGFGVVCCVSTR